MKLNVYHHVYTSINGYKTVKVSQSVPKNTLDMLEEYSKQIHRLARRTVRFSILGFDEIFVCLSRLSLAGSDHVGRTRALVHNLLFRREDVEALPFFDVFSVPAEIFMDEQADVAMCSARLPESFEFSPRNPATAFPSDQLPQKTARNVLRCMLHDGTSIVRSVEGQAFAAARVLLALLPPVAREHLTVVTGDYIQACDGRTRHTVFIVPPEFDVKPFSDAGFPVLDDGGQTALNLPKAHPYTRMVLGLLYGGEEDRARLAPLLRAINTYRPAVPYSFDAYQNLVQGLLTAGGFFSRDGRLHVEGAPEKGLEAALSFFRAGHPDIVFDIFSSCLRLLGKRNMQPALANFENVVMSGIDTLKEFFSEVPQDVQILEDIADFDE